MADGGYRSVRVDGGDMRCYLHLPKDAQGPPGVVVLGGTDGISAQIETVVDHLAAEGIAAASPDLFHRGARKPAPGNPTSSTLHVAELLADVRGAIGELRDSGIAPERIGIVGFTLGGLVTYLLTGLISEFRAAVVFAPSYVFKPLGEGKDPAPFDVTADIGCPLLIFTGGDDVHPSPEDAARMDEALTRLGKVHEVHTYPGVGHGRIVFTGDEGGDPLKAHAAEDAWSRCLGWLHRYL